MLVNFNSILDLGLLEHERNDYSSSSLSTNVLCQSKQSRGSSLPC